MAPLSYHSLLLLLTSSALACGSDPRGTGSSDATVDAMPTVDARDGFDGGSGNDGGSGSDGGIGLDGGNDGGVGLDAGLVTDAAVPPDAMISPDASIPPDAMILLDASLPADATILPDAEVLIISGGPCISGASGQTAYRVRWLGNGAGSTAYPGFEINGLPDTSRDDTGAYGYQIGFTPSYVDNFLGDGGLQLNASSFVDIEMSTLGISSIQSATLSIFGRSYNTTASGSFNWQTFSGSGSSSTNWVANSAPYEWYSADMTSALAAGDDGVLLRIKAGPSSSSLVVNRIELCIEAQ